MTTPAKTLILMLQLLLLLLWLLLALMQDRPARTVKTVFIQTYCEVITNVSPVKKYEGVIVIGISGISGISEATSEGEGGEGGEGGVARVDQIRRRTVVSFRRLGSWIERYNKSVLLC
jgi:hypothetical protein